MNQIMIAQQLCEITGQNMDLITQDGLHIEPGVLNAFFEKCGFFLEEEYISYNQIYDEYVFERILIEKHNKKEFIICGYNYSLLFNKYIGDAKHVSVICLINSKLDIVTIFDPGPENYGCKEVKLDELWYSIKTAQSGIWCVRSLTRKE